MATKLRKRVAVLVVMAASLIAVAHADTLVEFGIIDRVDYDKENAVVINDFYAPMALNLKVIDQRGVTVTRYALKKSQKVRFNITDSGQVDQIWLLPDNATPPPED